MESLSQTVFAQDRAKKSAQLSISAREFCKGPRKMFIKKNEIGKELSKLCKRWKGIFLAYSDSAFYAYCTYE